MDEKKCYGVPFCLTDQQPSANSKESGDKNVCYSSVLNKTRDKGVEIIYMHGDVTCKA